MIDDYREPDEPSAEEIDEARSRAASCSQRWHQLTSIRDDDGLKELLAATSDDGIGLIVRWTRNRNGWLVQAIDTEGCEWEQVRFFGGDEIIPEEPPTDFDDITANAKLTGQ